MSWRWFLTLFDEYRELDAQHAAFELECAQLEKENESLINKVALIEDDKRKMWDMVHSCIAGERSAYQMQVNVEWQRKGFGAPYPESPHIPVSMEPRSGVQTEIPRPTLPSEAVSRKTADFIRTMVEKSM